MTEQLDTISCTSSEESKTSDEVKVLLSEKDYERLYLKYVKKNKKLQYLLLKSQAEARYVLKKDDDATTTSKRGSKKGSKKGSPTR